MKGRERPRNMFLQWRKMCVFSRRNRKRRTDRLSITDQTSAGHFFFRNFYDAAKDSSKRSRDIKMKKTGSAARNGGPDQLFGVFFYVQIIKRKKSRINCAPSPLMALKTAF